MDSFLLCNGATQIVFRFYLILFMISPIPFVAEWLPLHAKGGRPTFFRLILLIVFVHIHAPDGRTLPSESRRVPRGRFCENRICIMACFQSIQRTIFISATGCRRAEHPVELRTLCEEEFMKASPNRTIET